MGTELKTPDEWLVTPEFKGLLIKSPDGWAKEYGSWEKNWQKPITKKEMWARLFKSKTINPGRNARL